ncbi:MAG: OmpA family protein [Tateyamaria sp.]|uniref:OmpA family protein n=3 Tax=Tateyamaria sp. TaxID=1929288 RepID=UPI00328A5306
MAKLTMNSPGGHAPRQSEFSQSQSSSMPVWVWAVGGLAFLFMFAGLVVTTTLLIVQSNRSDQVREIATQLNEPSYAEVETDVVTRQDVNILEADVAQAAAAPATPEVVAAVAAPTPAPVQPETRVASASIPPVRLGAAHRYRVPSCVDYLDTLVKITNVRFAVGSDAPIDADMPRVRNIATAVSTCDEVKVIVEGHSDRQGNPELNMRLSWFRAQSIIDQLQKEGFEITALQPRGFGAERPINLSGTTSGEAENRRVQFALAPRGAAPATPASDR